MMSQPGPKVPSPTLTDVGKGRILRGRDAILERFDGTGWRQVPSAVTRAMTIAGVVLFGLIVAFCVYVLFG